MTWKIKGKGQLTIDGKKADEKLIFYRKIDKTLNEWNGKNSVKIERDGDNYTADFNGSIVSRNIDAKEVKEFINDKEGNPVDLFACDVGYCHGEPDGDLSPLNSIDGELEYEKVCESCKDSIESNDRSEPCATVVYSNGEASTIGHYHDDTEGEFRTVYHRTDGWRGYYKVESDTYEQVHSDCILSYSDDERELKNFDDELREIFDKKGIRYARVFTRSSNVFSTGYDFFVHKDNLKELNKMLITMVVNQLRIKYRDNERFKLTALTGKSGDFDKSDKLLGKAYVMLEEGKDFEEVKEMVEKEITKN